MRFQVPQNLDVPEAILLGLSFIQIIYLGGAIGLFIFLFFFVGFSVAFIITAPVGVFAALLSFYKHNNQPFIEILQAVVLYAMNDKLYVWKKEEQKEINKPIITQDTSKQLKRQSDFSEADRIKTLLAELEFAQDDRQAL